MNFLWSLWYKFRDWRFERRCIKHLGMKPTKMYITKEQYDALQKRLAEPPDPKVVERFKEIMSKKPPWEE